MGLKQISPLQQIRPGKHPIGPRWRRKIEPAALRNKSDRKTNPKTIPAPRSRITLHTEKKMRAHAKQTVKQSLNSHPPQPISLPKGTNSNIVVYRNCRLKAHGLIVG
jgi:hypothetical protein